MGIAASYLSIFLQYILSALPFYTPLDSPDRSHPQFSDMLPQMRTRSGLERPPSGSLKTPESAEKDQQAHECLRQIEERSELTQESFDHLLKLLSDRHSLQISILPSCDIDGKPFDLTSSNFLAPLLRPITQNWSVIYVQTIEDSGRYTVNVKHYCPDPAQQRRSAVVNKLRSEAHRRYGKDAKVHYTLEEGPTASHENETGIYALMGALDFGIHHSIQSKGKFWGSDPVDVIKAALHTTQSRYPTPGSTPARRGSSISSADNGAEGMRTPARTPKTSVQKGWGRPSCEEMDIFGNKTPTAGSRKRRRLDPAEPVAFDVNEKLKEATSSILNLGLPSVAYLEQELDERRKERNEHKEVVENKKGELEKCQTERASRVTKHDIIVTDFKRLGDDIAADEKAAEEDLAAIPPPTRKFNFPMPQSLSDTYRELFEANIAPQRQRHEELRVEKHEASVMLKSVEEVCTTREKEVGQAEVEMGVIEERVKTAYMRKEFVAMK